MCSQKAAMNTCLVTSALVANASVIIALIAPTVNPTLFVGIMYSYDILYTECGVLSIELILIALMALLIIEVVDDDDIL